MRLPVIFLPLFVVAVMVSSCVTEPPRSAAEIAADNQIEMEVMQKLDASTTIYARHIDVKARGGVVRLSGDVTDGYELVEAGRLALSVPGVKKVRNELEIDMDGRGKGRGG